MRDWYRAPTAAPPVRREITWIDILSRWTLVCLDLSQIHRIDMESSVLDERSWPWLEMRILDMVRNGPRLSAALTAQLTSEGGTSVA